MIKDWILAHKWETATAVLAIGLASNLMYPRETIVEKEVIKTVTVEKEVVKWKDRVTTKDKEKTTTITKKDGTVKVIVDKTKENSKTTETVSKEEKKNETLEERGTTTTGRAHSRYRVGIHYPVPNYLDVASTTVTLGVRLFSFPVFVEGSVEPLHQEFKLGLSYEW